MSENKNDSSETEVTVTQPQKKKSYPTLNIEIKGTPQQYIQNMIEERQSYLFEVARNDSYDIPIYDENGNIKNSMTIHKLDISQRVFEELQKKKAEIDDLDKMTRINLPDAMRLGLQIPPNFITAHQEALEKRETYYKEVGEHKIGLDITHINTNKRMLLDILDAWMLQEDTGLPSPTNRSSSTSSSTMFR